jgi:hypothetical protein
VCCASLIVNIIDILRKTLLSNSSKTTSSSRTPLLITELENLPKDLVIYILIAGVGVFLLLRQSLGGDGGKLNGCCCGGRSSSN